MLSATNYGLSCSNLIWLLVIISFPSSTHGKKWPSFSSLSHLMFAVICWMLLHVGYLLYVTWTLHFSWSTLSGTQIWGIDLQWSSKYMEKLRKDSYLRRIHTYIWHSHPSPSNIVLLPMLCLMTNYNTSFCPKPNSRWKFSFLPILHCLIPR